jgi:hypothetical protein
MSCAVTVSCGRNMRSGVVRSGLSFGEMSVGYNSYVMKLNQNLLVPEYSKKTREMHIKSWWKCRKEEKA